MTELSSDAASNNLTPAQERRKKPAEARKRWAKMAIAHTTELCKPKPGTRAARIADFAEWMTGYGARLMKQPMDRNRSDNWQAGWTAADKASA